MLTLILHYFVSICYAILCFCSVLAHYLEQLLSFCDFVLLTFDI